VSLLNGLNERGVSALIYVEVGVRRQESHRSGDRKNPDIPVNSMSADGALCNMARTALRSPSATALRREAIILVGNGLGGGGQRPGREREKRDGNWSSGESDVDVVQQGVSRSVPAEKFAE